MVNKVTLIGHLGADPEHRVAGSGLKVTSASIATTEKWRDRQTGDLREQTEWHRLEFFNKNAENAAQLLKKGSQVYIEGKLKTDRWTDQNNVERWSTKVQVQLFKLLGGGAGRDSGGNDDEAPVNSDPDVPPNSQPAGLEDDIPF